MTTYSIWAEDGEPKVLVAGAERPKLMDGIPVPGAVDKAAEFEAASWEEAKRYYDRFLSELKALDIPFCFFDESHTSYSSTRVDNREHGSRTGTPSP